MIEAGQTVVVHYRGTLNDGTVFDNSYDRGEPIIFEAGAGYVIPGFDKAILSMEVGERKTVKIPAAEAYGNYQEGLLQTIPLDAVPNSDQLPEGEFIYMQMEGADPIPCKVLKIENGEVTFDYNPRLAGEDLTFEIELISTVD